MYSTLEKKAMYMDIEYRIINSIYIINVESTVHPAGGSATRLILEGESVS